MDSFLEIVEEGPSERGRDVKASVFRWWQLSAVFLLVALCDVVIYRGEGYAGYAALCLGAPLLMAAASRGPRRKGELVLLSAMLVLLAGRLVWFGSVLQVAVGFGLLAAFAAALCGLRPYVLETLAFASQTVTAGYVALSGQHKAARRWSPVSSAGFLAVAFPLAAFVAFGLLFVLANPDLAAAFGEHVERIATAARDWLRYFSATEVLFWMGVFWISAGLLRPVMQRELLAENVPAERQPQEEAVLYAAFRNTLLTVIGLFAVYLVFEFKTLWFRVFPKGFYYSGYAHEGAFWLTVALALTTLTLSLVFRGRVLNDPRLAGLRRLAWLWSLENLLLAAAVYHRLLIYVGFNGMTRMRVVGFCGISAVVVGFLLVVYKIAASRGFVWLVRRQLWTLFLFVYAYAITPVDALVMQYNVQRILSGDPAPCVQISVHPIDPDGLLQLPPLLESDDGQIREGVRALLSVQYELAQARLREQQRAGWTSRQWGDRVLAEQLSRYESRLTFDSRSRRAATLRKFHSYAYQWY